MEGISHENQTIHMHSESFIVKPHHEREVGEILRTRNTIVKAGTPGDIVKEFGLRDHRSFSA